ncbi:hypothetical protein D9M71_619610 [compost metagenome]
MYEKCFTLLVENEGLGGKCSYLFRLNRFLQCESNSDGDEISVLCVLTLCELTSEIVKARESFLAGCIGCNYLELNLEVALGLPGEVIGCNDVRWPTFGLTSLSSAEISVIDMCEVRERIQMISSDFLKSKKSHPLDELNRCSLLYVDILALFSRLECHC